MRDPFRIAEAFPRHRPSGPSVAQIEAARRIWERHVPNMVTYACATCGSVRWPCRTYRNADALLRTAGMIDLDGTLRPVVH